MRQYLAISRLKPDELLIDSDCAMTFHDSLLTADYHHPDLFHSQKLGKISIFPAASPKLAQNVNFPGTPPMAINSRSQRVAAEPKALLNALFRARGDEINPRFKRCGCTLE